jgi:hypothetical protein
MENKNDSPASTAAIIWQILALYTIHSTSGPNIGNVGPAIA